MTRQGSAALVEQAIRILDDLKHKRVGDSYARSLLEEALRTIQDTIKPGEEDE